MKRKILIWMGSSKKVFVLHAFQKKYKQGIKTPKEDIGTNKETAKASSNDLYRHER